jgi:predicted MPP superfamily phosphohydrolase
VLLLVLLGSCYRLPLWSGEVKVEALTRESIAKCGNGALTTAGAAAITRDPYLQSTTTTSTIVAWGSRNPHGRVVISEPDGGDAVVTADASYAGDPGEREDREEAWTEKDEEGEKLEAEDIYVVKAELKGLKPTHLYCYQVFNDDIALTEKAPMTTASAPDDKEHLRFVALGDTGTGGPAQRAIAKWISAQPFDLMLFLGDIAYESGTAQQLQDNFFAVYRDFMKFVPVYPTIGNHERRTRRGRPYFEAFVLPEPERYYSFDWGNVHFVCIDTTQRDSTQLVWLDDDLLKNKLPWVIVYGHHPMYTNSLRGAQLWIRRAFSKILTKHKVDLVLTGHEHQYERFKVNGINYIVSGGGGGQLTRFFGASRALTQYTVHHFLAFDVTAKELDMKVIDISGRELEKLHLTKDGAGENKQKVNDKPDKKENVVPPEQKVVPDEKLHDEPDDDEHRKKVIPAASTPPPAPPPPAAPVPTKS